MGAILRAMLAYFTSHPEKVAVISKVAGKTLTSPQAVVSWAKGNKVNLALAAVNMGSSGLMIADYLSGDTGTPANALKIINAMSFVPDELPKDAKLSLDDLSKYGDELALIRRVTNRVGGTERLMELRTVLAMPDQYFELDQAIKSLAR